MINSTFQDSTRTYGFPPLLCEEPRNLILGTLPGGESLEHRQYYYSSSNRIWKVLCHLTGEPMPVDYTQKKALLAKYHIVLWDLPASSLPVEQYLKGCPGSIIGSVCFNRISQSVFSLSTKQVLLRSGLMVSGRPTPLPS